MNGSTTSAARGACQSNPHYVEKAGDTDLVFLEMLLVVIALEHLGVEQAKLDAIPQDKEVIPPWLNARCPHYASAVRRSQLSALDNG